MEDDDMTRWDPWRELFVVPLEMTQFFNPGLAFTGAREQAPTTYLPLDVRQTDSEFVLEASVPGFAAEDIEVVAEKGTLTIRGERKSDEELAGRYLRRERRQSSFVRQLTLPAEVRESEITARFVNGVLTVRVPRVEAPAPTRIKVEAGAEAPALETTAAPVTA
ncbi:MAG: Hsp20/alpha crystallin family protein [Candidatus Dormiibacterota bacterium]